MSTSHVTDDVVLAGRALPLRPGVARAIARSPEQIAAVVITASLAFRTILALALGLSADESYGIAVAHDLLPAYFDHAPLSYWIIHAFQPLLGDGRAMRLPFVVMFAGTSWLLFLQTRQLFGGRAGAWAVLALSLSGFFTLASGWALPDGPLMFCLAAAGYTLSLGFFPESHRVPPSPWRTWLTAGIFIGLAGLSKYHAALMVVGLLAFVMSAPQRRRLLRHPAPWAGAALALTMLMPVIIWNAQHKWASFAFQSARALHDGSFPKTDQFLQNIGGQFLYVLPWVLVPMLIAIAGAVRGGPRTARSWYFLCLGLPAVLFFTAAALWVGRIFPHWEMPGWLMLFPLLGDHLAREAAVRSRPRTWAITSAVLLGALALAVVGYIETGAGKLLVTTEDTARDPTLDFVEWAPLRDELSKRGLLDRPGLFVVSGNASDIGAIAQALGDELPMQVFGDAKQFAFRVDPRALIGRDALIMGRRDRMDGVAEGLAPYFESIEALAPFVFGRSGMKEIDVPIYYGHALRKPLPRPAYADAAD